MIRRARSPRLREIRRGSVELAKTARLQKRRPRFDGTDALERHVSGERARGDRPPCLP
jgi:hypothetical protein